MKLQELQKIDNKPKPPKNLWLIAPEGTVLTCNGYHFHGGYIKDNINSFDFTEKQIKEIEKSDNSELPQILILKDNWITVRSDGLIFDFCISKKNYKYKDQLFDFLLELGKKYNVKGLAGAQINFLDTDRSDCFSFRRGKFYSIDDIYMGEILKENGIISFKNLLKLQELEKDQEWAREIAKFAHDDEGQKRKGSGLPYWTHTQTVASIVEAYGGSREQIAAAELHDTQEDTKLPLEIIEDRKKDDPKSKTNWNKVANLVIELTNLNREVKKIGKESYMNSKLVNLSNDALLIKLADFYSNLTDLPGEKQRIRMVNNLKFLIKNRKFNKKCIRILRSIFTFIKSKKWY